MEKAEREIDRESGICNWAGASEYFVDAAEIFIREGDFCQGGEAYVRASGMPLAVRRFVVVGLCCDVGAHAWWF